MSVIGSNILSGASGQGGAYEIENSMYIGDAPDSSPKISRTFNQAGSTSPKWTFATWYKKGRPTTSAKTLYYFEPSSVGASATVEFSFQNDTDAAVAGLRWNAWSGSATPWDWNTNGGMAFRDYGAWYHICHVIDYSTSPYVFLYINGVLQDPSTIYGTKNGAGYGTNYAPVSGDLFRIGSNNSNQLGNGYLADTYWIEQQALNPVGTFGEFNEDTGQFVPIEYTGTFAGNSVYLDYSDSADFGTDSSGLGNDFTVTSIPAHQHKLDSPSNNFATLNPLYNWSTSTDADRVYSEGNLKGSSSATGWKTVASSQAIESGKWYWETTCFGSYNWQPGLARTDLSTTLNIGLELTGSYCVYCSGPGSGGTFVNSTHTVNNNYIWADTDILMCAYDDATGYFWVGKNGTWFNSGNPAGGSGYLLTVIAADRGDMVPAFSYYASTDGMRFNFGADSSFQGTKTAQGNGGVGEDFYYTPPTGFKALNTDNLDDPAIEDPTDHFNTVIHTGAGGTYSLTGVGFQPDFIWIKQRSGIERHTIVDSVRGANKNLTSHDTAAETTDAADGHLDSIDSDGWTGEGDKSATTSTNVTFAGWYWKAGGTASSNTDGDITSSVSANTTAGFSIVKYTGSGVAGDTMGHGLSQTPEMVFMKKRVSNGADGVRGWHVWSNVLTDGYYLSLNATNGQFVARDFGEVGNGTYPYTDPTSSLITFGGVNTGAYQEVNYSGDDYIMYCFHSVDGYSKVGSYEGNGNANGSFIYLGFKPEFFLIKNIDATEGWEVWDGTREPYNKLSKKISPNTTEAEYTGNTTTYAIDFVSNGVKLRTSYSAVNAANTFLYYAVASSPFKTSNAR